MPTVNQGWAYVSSSTASGTPGGEDTNIQFNNNGAFSGSNLLITDGSGSLSASVNISASAFYGDGSNITGLTASAVNVADGPEQAIQFRVDTPVSGEISGSSAFMFMTASNTVKLDGAILSSSTYISASAFYGDGSNLTNVTASAVQVADGPQYSLQFRFDSPVSGDLSGSSDLLWDPATSDVLISGSVRLEDGKEFYGDLEGAILFVAKVDEVGGIGKGKAVYIKGLSGTTPTIGLAACDDPAKMPAFGLCAFSASNNTTTQVATFGSLDGLNLNNISPGHSFSEGDILYVNTGSGGAAGTFTNIKPTGSSNLLQNIGKIVRNGASSNGQIKVGGAGRANDTPNLDKGHIFIGNDTDQTIQDNTIFISASANRVGINNTNPDHTLTVGGDISASVNISASAFYGNGAGITGISLINLDAAGSDTNIQFNQNGEFAGAAGLAWDGTSSMTVSSSAWGIAATTYVGAPATSSNGGRVKLLGPSSSTAAYIGTDNLYVSIEDTPMNVSRLQIVNDGGMVNLSSSMDVTVNNYAAGEQYFEVNTNVATYTLYTGSLGGEDLEYVWSINNGNAPEEDESSWVKLDVSSSTKNFTVGGRDNIQLIANAGLQVDNAASTFNSVANFNADMTGSQGLLLNRPATQFGQLHLSSSDPDVGFGAMVYGDIFFGSGSIAPGDGWNGASIGLINFGAGQELRLRDRNGGVALMSDAGEVVLSASAGIVNQTNASFNGTANFNNSVNTNAQLNVNNTSSFGGPATFNDHSASFNRGVNIGGEAAHQMLVNVTGNFNNITSFGDTATFNSGLVANGDVTLGDASGDGVTWNAGSWNMSANAVVTTLKDGVDGTGGPGGNGALLFMTGSGGDFMRFHTSGSAKGIYFPQQTYLSKGGSLSGTLAGPGSFLALDSDNKVVLATPSAGGASVFTEIDGSSAATTSSIAVGTSGTPQATLQVSSSGNEALLAVAGATNGTVLFLSGSSHMGLGTSARTGFTSTTGSQTTLTINKSANISIPSPGREAFAGLHFEPSLASDGNSMGITFGANISSHANKTLSGIWSNADSSKGNSLLFGTSDSYGAGAKIRMTISTGGLVGVGTTSPKAALDVHYTGSGNPTGLGDDTGGGDVVYFGTGSANLTVGGLYYLNSDGGWESADAALTGSGHNQLMGIALGTDPGSSGVLVKGYFHADSSFSGSFIKGGPVYIQSSSVGRSPTGGGYFSASAPTAEDSYVRVVGYGTDTANVIYFNPDSTYVEIGS